MMYWMIAAGTAFGLLVMLFVDVEKQIEADEHAVYYIIGVPLMLLGGLIWPIALAVYVAYRVAKLFRRSK